MKKRFKLRFFLLIASFCTNTAFGITAKKTGRYVYDLSDLRASLSIDVRDKIKEISIPVETVKRRSLKSKADRRIEPFSLRVPGTAADMLALAKELAKPKSSGKLYEYFSDKYHSTFKKKFRDGSKKIELSPESLKWIRYSKLEKKLARKHHSVSIEADAFTHKPRLGKRLLAQLKPFLTPKQINAVRSRVRNRSSISVDRYLLPTFAKKMVRRYIAFQGPNCFHASLAFHGQTLTSSPFINVKKEEGYHRSMINYDELWRAINQQFYEVDVDQSNLKYGDMIVFFELPKEGGGPTYFRWIRHAATYLFGQYTFSKGSKSADTPYTVKTLEEEWQTWRKYTKNLGVKVFRRSSKRVRRVPPASLTDWLY